MSKSKEPLVTMIVAIYNGEKFLDECIQSIIGQTYSNLEIILVDDGSTDSSLSICKKYEKKDGRVKVVHQENGGVSKARNNALKNAKGEYVCFIDQDDLIIDKYVGYLLDLVIKNKTEIAVVPNVVYYAGDRQIYSEKHSDSEYIVWTGEYAACEMLYSKMEIGPWSKIFSRELIDKNSVSFYEGIFGGEGYAFSVECFSKTRKVAVGYKGIYYYRVNNYESEMSKYRHRTLLSSLKAVEIMMDEFKNESRSLRRASKYAYWRVFVTFLNTLIASGTEKENMTDYKLLVKNSRKYAYRSFFANVPLKRKIKDLLYFISPVLVARINVKTNIKRQFNR